MFCILLPEQNITKKEQVKEKFTKLEFEFGNSKKYKVKAIWDTAVYVNKAESHLPGLYYLVAWKEYPKEEDT